MSRFDKVLDKKNAEQTLSEQKAEAEKRDRELEIERRKAQYLPIIRKYWQQFQEVLPRLNYDDTTEVVLNVPLVSLTKKIKVKWLNNLNDAVIYCLDKKGKVYISARKFYYDYVKPIKDSDIEETIFNLLPWSEYDYWTKNHTVKIDEDLSVSKRKAIGAVFPEMKDGNADEAVAKYFESLI